MEIKGNIVLIEQKKIKTGKILIENGRIKDIVFDNNKYENYILPGLIDSHIHIESTMMTPDNFADVALENGTVAIVTDPHEIANVMGIKGVEFMMESAKTTNLKIFFGIPSCVPATEFESSGAKLSAIEIENLLQTKNVVVLSEMMNYPGVIYEDKNVLQKIKVAKSMNLPIDGHAPGLSGKDLEKYVLAGISTDHECATKQEALEKISMGMKIQIREGSAARNFDALFSLIDIHPDEVMLCTDDSHPDELLERGHINKIVKMGIAKGVNIFNLLKAACMNPVVHYNLPVGLLKINDPADFIVVDNLKNFNIIDTYINGESFKKKKLLSKTIKPINYFEAENISKNDIEVLSGDKDPMLDIIQAFDGELLTKRIKAKMKVVEGRIIPSPSDDILKIVVLNRYTKKAKPAVAFIKGFGIKNGAIASTIAHDSHNIIAVGTSDELIIKAINRLIEIKGGIVAINSSNKMEELPLPVAGLMSIESFEAVAKQYKKMNSFVFDMHCKMQAPFMTLSFMALLVIPEIKLSDKGLFDAKKFEFIPF